MSTPTDQPYYVCKKSLRCKICNGYWPDKCHCGLQPQLRYSLQTQDWAEVDFATLQRHKPMWSINSITEDLARRLDCSYAIDDSTRFVRFYRKDACR